MPRGVAIPELKQQLFTAVERLLNHDGPSELSSRRITAEAGVAKGVLHNHFVDLDQFLAEFVMAAFHAAHLVADELQTMAGQGTVPDNLAQTADSLLGPRVAAAHNLLSSRPSLIARLGERHGHRAPGLASLEQSFTRYIDAERELGRITADADTEAMAIALVATIHRVLVGGDTTAEPRSAIRRVISALTGPTRPGPRRSEGDATPLTPAQ